MRFSDDALNRALGHDGFCVVCFLGLKDQNAMSHVSCKTSRCFRCQSWPFRSKTSALVADIREQTGLIAQHSDQEQEEGAALLHAG
jgi:hypothetical protein